MFNRFSLSRFKKAEATEPFRVDEIKAGPIGSITYRPQNPQSQQQIAASSHSQNLPWLQGQQQQLRPAAALPGAILLSSSPGAGKSSQLPLQQLQHTTAGEGGSTWQPPEWAVEPRPGIYSLDVLKDGSVVDNIPLSKKRVIFGRQQATCDFVLDHPSLSRQHAAIVHRKNGSVFVIDLGSVHGTFVSNERLLKDIPVEIEPGQSLRFAGSTRTYVLRRSAKPPPAVPELAVRSEEETAAALIQLPPPPDTADLEAVMQYNTMLNRLTLPATVTDLGGRTGDASEGDNRKRKREESEGRKGALKKRTTEEEGLGGVKKNGEKVRFRDEFGGILVQVVGFSDGFDVDTSTGPVGVKEGCNLIGQFDSLVQTVVIPRVRTKNTAASGAGSTAVGKLEGISSGSSGGRSAVSSSLAVVNNRPRVSPAARMRFPQSQGLYRDAGVSHVEKSSEKWANKEAIARGYTDGDRVVESDGGGDNDAIDLFGPDAIPKSN